MNAHTGDIERSWNNIQNAKIPGILGNKKIGKSYQNMDVYRYTGNNYKYCAHYDGSKRVQVSTRPIIVNCDELCINNY